MNVNGEFTFNGPRDVVWELLQDPDVLKQALPGARRLERTGEDTYEGVMKVGLGPVNAEFVLQVTLGDKVAPERFTMTIDSKGALGFSRGTAKVSLQEAPGGATTMRYESEMQIGGKLASIGQRVVDSAAKTMTAKGLEALQKALDARLKDGPR